MKYQLNIIILLFSIFQIIYSIDMKYLINNVYSIPPPLGPSLRPQSSDLAITHTVYALISCKYAILLLFYTLFFMFLLE